jgi:DUF4097 and DUF4098 domain-containing protein YvlB
MKTARIITIICWIVVAVVLIGLALWFFTGSIFGIGLGRWGLSIRDAGLSFRGSTGGWESLSGPYKIDGAYSVPTAGINSINIDWVAGEVTIKPHDGAEIEITEYAQRELNDNEKVRFSTSGGRLTIRFREQNARGNMPQKRLDVLVPHELCANLYSFSVSTVSGRVDAESIGAGIFTAGSTSGAINISDVSSRTFEAKAISGAITVASVQSESIEISSTSGAITVTSAIAAGDMEIESISGTIRVTGSSAGTIDCNTTSGGIDINGAFDGVKLNSLSGRISMNNSASRSNLRVGSTSGSVDMTGAFSRVDANTLSGGISVRSTIVPTTLKIETTSGNVNIAVPVLSDITVHHSSTSGKFSSDIPIMMQGRGARFEISSLSGDTKITAID